MSDRPPAPVAPRPADLPTHLGDLRTEIDRIDDTLHDLLMRRAQVVERVAALGRIGKIPFRPGREAAIIRRLLARHTGHLPRHAIVRLWREMYAANISIEAPFTIATCRGGPGAELVQVAREHFGALTPLRVSGTAAEALADIRAARATAAVVPMPGADAGVWWTALLDAAEPRLRVVARLPFWASPRPEGAVTMPALVVAAAAPDASGSDRSLLALPVSGGSDPAQLAATFAGGGLDGAGSVFLDSQSGWMLVDAPGHVTEAGLPAWPGARVVGGYAVPVTSDAPQ